MLSKLPNSTKVILLYSLLAESMLCSITARSNMVDPEKCIRYDGINLNSVTVCCPRFLMLRQLLLEFLQMLSFNNSIQIPAAESIRINKPIKYTYIFSRIANADNCWHRSSLNNVASIRDRCWPAEAKIVHVNACCNDTMLSAWASWVFNDNS